MLQNSIYSKERHHVIAAPAPVKILGVKQIQCVSEL
jgi:hypothetical protein